MGPLIELPHDGFLPKFRGLGDHLSDSSQRPPAPPGLSTSSTLWQKWLYLAYGVQLRSTKRHQNWHLGTEDIIHETAHPVPLELAAGHVELVGD